MSNEQNHTYSGAAEKWCNCTIATALDSRGRVDLRQDWRVAKNVQGAEILDEKWSEPFKRKRLKLLNQ